MKLSKKLLLRLIIFLPAIISSACSSSDSGTTASTDSGYPTFTPSIDSGNPNKMGMNISSPLDWEPDTMLNDAMISARQWTVPGSGEIVTNLDSNYWPQEDADIIVWHNQPNAEPGIYTLSFDGQADVTVGLTTSEIVSNSYDVGTDKTTMEINLTNELPNVLSLSFRNTSGGVKNVKLIRANRNNNERFNPDVLNAMQYFSTIRFMDFTATNSNSCSSWDDRVKPEYSSHFRSLFGDADGDNFDDYGWQGKGFSWELAIALANAANCDMWICVPILADDNYVTNLAQLIRDGRTDDNGTAWEGLNSNLNLIIELSNEVWNTGYSFWQFTYNNQAALAECDADTDTFNLYNYDGEIDLDAVRENPRSTAGFILGRRRTIKRLIEISQLFRAEFGDDQIITRIRPYLGWQIGNANNVAAAMMNFWEESLSTIYSDNINDYIWGGGGTAYYSPDDSISYNINTIWSSGHMDVRPWMDTIQKDSKYASLMGIEYAAYEGGPGFADIYGSGASLNRDIKQEAWYDPRIKQNVLDHHAVWNRSGGGLLCYFTFASNYEFGFVEDPKDLTTPKMSAITTLASQNAELADQERELPCGTTDANTFNAASPSWYSPADWTTYGYIDIRENTPYGWLAYFFIDDEATVYTFTYDYLINEDNVELNVIWNGEILETITTTASADITQGGSFTINSKKGLNSLRFSFKKDGMGTNSARCNIVSLTIE